MTVKFLFRGIVETGEPEEAPFSEGLEPSESFLRLWGQTKHKRNIARRLERMRIEKDLTQAEVAKLIDVDPTYVSKMESSTGSLPKADLIARFAAVCGYDLAYAFINRDREVVEFEIVNPIPTGSTPSKMAKILEIAAEAQEDADVTQKDAAIASVT